MSTPQKITHLWIHGILFYDLVTLTLLILPKHPIVPHLALDTINHLTCVAFRLNHPSKLRAKAFYSKGCSLILSGQPNSEKYTAWAFRTQNSA